MLNMQKRYIPSYFLGMFCIRRDVSDECDSYNDFLTLSGVQPDISITTKSFVVHIMHSPTTQISVDDEQGVTVILHGEIYNSNGSQPQFLVQQYIQRGIALSVDISGSFVVLVIDKHNDNVAVITDRVNSRKAFYSEYKGSYWLSSSLNLHPTEDAGVDPVGVAHYLASGAIHNNRTLFDGIRVLERACVHTLSRDGFHGTSYWSYEFTNSYSDMTERQLRGQLSELLVQSVKVRLADDPKVFVAISGGYDSTTILGILGSRLNISDVECFTLSHGEPKPGSDEYIARQTCLHFGFHHKIVETQKGDHLEMMHRRAKLGRGMPADFVYSMGGYEDMASALSSTTPSVLFFGDECSGPGDWEINSRIEALKCTRVSHFGVLSWLQNTMPKNTYDILYWGLREDINQIISRCPFSEDPQNWKDFFFLDQYLNNLILPLREFLAGSFITVRNPFLDNSLLEFMKAVPSIMRCGRRLFEDVVTSMFPDLFRFKRAYRQSSFVVDLRKEMTAHAAEIEESILSQSSKLDYLMPPGLIVKILEENRRRADLSPRTLAIRMVRRSLRGSILNNTFIDGKVSSYYMKRRKVDPYLFLKRFLLARSALT